MVVCQLYAKKLHDKKMKSLIIANPAIVRDFFRTIPIVKGYLYLLQPSCHKKSQSPQIGGL